jgi:hypothetical protein
MATKRKSTARKTTAVSRHTTAAHPRKTHTRTRRSYPVRRKRQGMSAAPRAAGFSFEKLLKESAGGAAAAVVVNYVPVPEMLSTIPKGVVKASYCIIGSYVTAKFAKQPAIAAGMSGAAGFILANMAFGNGMQDDNFSLSDDIEIIDAQELQELEELEELEEGENDEQQFFLAQDGQEVMLCDDGEYRYVQDGAIYQVD